ncbi:MAG: 50S ribosomal protein L20 [Candidatus Saganbacteria bacterium]|nr:50S ribosomal protein L20 [Candidatus Saganbacteria bacterium]
MVRVKRGNVARKKKRKQLKRAKGFRGGLRTQLRRRKQAIVKAKRHATRGRRQKKSAMRRLWIVRINAAVRQAGLSYSRFMAGLKKKKIELDRRSLADLAANHPADFKQLLEVVKTA